MNVFFKVKVEQLKVVSPFLKISAKILNSPSADALSDLAKYFKEAPNVGVQIGGMCIAEVTPGSFERCRLIHVNSTDKMATVWFTDCNYQGVIPCSQLRILYDSYLQNLNGLCKDFIIAEIKMAPDSSYKQKILKLHDLLIGKSFEATVLKKNEAGRFAELKFINGSSLQQTIADDPLLKDLLKPIPLNQQMNEMLKMKIETKENFKLDTLVESHPLHSSSSESLVPASDVPFSVRIASANKSYGPLSFYVHYIDQDDEYQRFQCDLQKLKKSLIPLTFVPPRGKHCIASIDNQLNRVITGKSVSKKGESYVLKDQVWTFLLDKGRDVLVDWRQLYEMPLDLVIVSPYAKQFQLDYQEGSISHLKQNEVDFYFQHITKQKTLALKIVTASQIPRCQLFVDKTDVLELIKRWNPHELRYQEQPKLKPGNFKITIVNIESPKLFYVQLKNPTEKAKHNIIVNNLCTIEPPMLRSPQINEACIVQHKGYNMRARIIKKITSKIFKLQLIDTGFIDDYHESEIKVSVQDLQKPGPFAFKCCIEGFENIDKITLAVVAEFIKITQNDKDLQMKVKAKIGDTYTVEMEQTNGNKLIRNALKVDLNRSDWTNPPTPPHDHFSKQREKNISAYSLSRSREELSDSDESVDDLHNEFGEFDNAAVSIWSDEYLRGDTSVKSDRARKSSSGLKSWKEPALITAVVSPTDFTIQNSSIVSEHEAFKEELQDLAKVQGPLTVFSAGSFCLALRPFDQMWCRAIILEEDSGDFLVTLKCVDDGSIFSVDKPSNLKSSSIGLVFKVYFGLSCSLPMECHARREKEATDVLMLMKNQDVFYRHVADFGNKRIVELYHEGKNIADHLVQMGCGKRLVFVPSGKAYISTVESMTNFTIQLESETELLREIMKYTRSYVHVQVKKPEVGMIVLGKYADVNWYRAKILQVVSANEYKVCFIDHGNTYTVKEIGAIDDSIIEAIHPQGYKCSLDLPREMKDRVNEDADEAFYEFSKVGKVNIKFLKATENFALIDIISNGVNIISEILDSQSGK